MSGKLLHKVNKMPDRNGNPLLIPVLRRCTQEPWSQQISSVSWFSKLWLQMRGPASVYDRKNNQRRDLWDLKSGLKVRALAEDLSCAPSTHSISKGSHAFVLVLGTSTHMHIHTNKHQNQKEDTWYLPVHVNIAHTTHKHTKISGYLTVSIPYIDILW